MKFSPLKVVLAIGDPAFNPIYEEMARVAVHTAREVGYDVVLIHDGPEPNIDVNMIARRSRFWPQMEKHLPTDAHLGIGTGAMLRLEVPFVLGDEYVLYTDLDVIFRRYVEPPKVKVWGMVHESEGGGHFNSGVAVMHLPPLRASRTEFDAFCYDIIEQGKLHTVTWDQGLINLFYGGEGSTAIETLPSEWNWRPYWGENEDAIILHFHGPKPNDTEEWIKQAYPENLRPDHFYTERYRWQAINYQLKP